MTRSTWAVAVAFLLGLAPSARAADACAASITLPDWTSPPFAPKGASYLVLQADPGLPGAAVAPICPDGQHLTNDALGYRCVSVATAPALAANGANCSAGQAPLGVDASGAAEGCWTPAPLGSPTFTGQTTIVGLTETVVAGGTCAGTYNVNPTLGTMVNLTLSGACAIGVTSLAAGHSFLIKLTQSATTMPTFAAAYKWESGTAPTWSASATKYDLVACISTDGTTLQCAAHTDLR